MLLNQMLNAAGPFQNDLQRTMNRVFGSQPFANVAPLAPTRAMPAVNLWEDQDNLYIESELPGMRLEDINVEIENDELTISGARSFETPEGAKALLRERAFGEFKRIVTLPYQVEIDDVQARLVNGVLTVTLPKSQAVKPRRIQISAS